MAGNQNSGRKQEKPFKDALRLELAKLKDDDQRGLRKIARVLIAAAEAGKMDAIRELADRVDGKVPQGLIGGDEGDNPINVITKARELSDDELARIAAIGSKRASKA